MSEQNNSSVVIACWLCGYEFEEVEDGWMECTGCCHGVKKSYALGFWEGRRYSKQDELIKPPVKPRYDDVFFDGLAWLDKQ